MKTRYSFILNSKLFLLLLYSSFSLGSLAQEASTCAENLRNAQTLFDNGQVEQVPAMLEECLRSGFKQEEELSAYKLMIQTFLFQDRNAEADSAMLSFFKKYPEYQLSPTDHSSFVHLYNNFSVRPVVQMIFRLGTNIPFVTFVDPQSMAVKLRDWDYSSKVLNLYASVEAKFALTSRLELNIEGGLSQLFFSTSENFFDNGTVSYSEIQYRIELPLTATYNIISFGSFTAYARAGAGPAFNLAAKAKDVSYKSFKYLPFPDQESPEKDRVDCRIRMDIIGQAGGGIKLKIPEGYFNFEIRTNLGVYNQVKNRTGSAEDLMTKYNYKDDDFNLNAVNFSIGYTKIFYRPLKRINTK